ncbi:MAG: SRPBCC family protein [Acidobacteriota bacterium]
MSTLDVTVSDVIDSPAEAVYGALGAIEDIPRRDAAVRRIEFLSDQRSGAGTRFRETRAMGKRLVETELEVTEAVPGESIRFVSDAGGTVWDTLYSCAPEGSGGLATRLTIAMEARPDKLLPKLTNRLILPLVRRGMAKHLRELKAHCEAAHPSLGT